jgi:hypothetical protein
MARGNVDGALLRASAERESLVGDPAFHLKDARELGHPRTLCVSDEEVKGLIRLIVMIVAMSFILAIFTRYAPSGDSETKVLGLPVVSVRQVGAYGWLAMGQAAHGILVIAQAGAGVVAFTQVGAACFFGIGQGMVSLVTLAQVGLGPFAFIGQVGFGAQAGGQGVWRSRPASYWNEVSDEVTDLLSWRGGSST